MKHRSTRELFAHWNVQRGDHLAPRHDDIRPAAMRLALEDVFILSFCLDQRHPFQLAGTRICRLFCRELKGGPFLNLWHDQDRSAIANLVEIVGKEQSGAVAGVIGQGDCDNTIDLELLMLPLRDDDRSEARIIGALSPATMPYWFGAHSIVDLRLRTVRHLGAAPPAIDASPLARRVASQRANVELVLMQGGKR